jgi:PAS domain S-box-containing protein
LAFAPWLGAVASSHVPEPTADISLPGLTGAERAWLQAHPVIRLGLNGVAPPWSYVVGDQYRGVHVDLIKRLSLGLGVRFEPVHGHSYGELLNGLNGDALVDAIGLLPATAENGRNMLFTEPVATVEYALIVREQASGPVEITDLVGKRIAVVSNFAVRRWLERDYPGVVVVPTTGTIEALRMVALGDADGAVSTPAGASWLIRQEGLVNLHMQQTLYRAPLSLGVRRDWPELVTILNKAIVQVSPAEIDRITAENVQVRTSGFTRQEILSVIGVIVALAITAVIVLQRQALERERRLATKLAQREREYRLLVENSLDGVLRTQPDGRILAANPAACAMFGMSEAELCESGRDRIVDRNDPRLAKLLQERAATGRARGTLTMRRADGTPFEAELSSSVYQEADGRLFNSLLIRDVSERHRAEARLRLMQACFENLNDAIVITEAEPFDEPGQRIVFVNAAFTHQTGYSADEAMGRSTRFLQGPETDRAELQRVGAALRRWEPVHTELLNYRKDGQPYWIEIKMVPIGDQTGWYTHWVAVERDVTARKAAEAARRQQESRTQESQKLEAIGTLAGGIAHDFNNILGAIVGQAAIASADLAGQGPGTKAAKESLAQIQVAADRARRLVQRILTFSRRDVHPDEVQAVAPVIRETVAMLKATLPANLKLDVHMTETALTVGVEATQLQQVVLNLCTNAWQALPELAPL